MRKCILIALLLVSTAASAEKMKRQSSVYDDFKQLNPGPSATADEETTALIKRYMANLLYPVDLSSLSGPDKDTTFRDLIIVLQQQMDVAPTGILTTDQFNRLAEASHNIDGDLIGLPGKKIFATKDGVSAFGTGTTDASPCLDLPGAGCDIGRPINFVQIFCVKQRGVCERYVATFDLKERFLSLDSGTEYEIDSWTPSRVTAREQTPCATFLMTIDVQSEQLTIVTVPQPDLSTCSGWRPPDRPSTWKLVEGLPIAMKLSRDRMNAARILVYPPARRLLPTQ